MELQHLSTVWLTGFSISLSLIVVIGSQNSFVLRQGLRREHVGPVVLVCALLDIVLMTVGVGGLAASMGSYPLAMNLLAWAGAVVLLVYGVQALRRALSAESLNATTAGSTQTLRAVVVHGLSLSLLNPHVDLDTVVLVGAVGARQPAGTQWAFLLGAGTASSLWFAGLGFGARLLAPVFARPRAWQALDVFVAVTLWANALGLVWLALKG